MGLPVELQGGFELLPAQCSFSQPEFDTQDIAGVAKATIDTLTFARQFIFHQHVNLAVECTVAKPVPVKLVFMVYKMSNVFTNVALTYTC